MPIQLTDNTIKQLPAPATGLIVYRDSKIKGLGVRVLPSGTKAFVLDYTKAGRRRVYTIGKTSEWQLGAAREEAAKLKVLIRHEGYDPAEALKTERDAPTVDDLCDRFLAEYLPKLRPSTRADYGRIIENDIRPALGKRKVVSVDHDTIHSRFQEISKRAPGAGNIFLALCSRLFNLATTWNWIVKNPVRGIDRNARNARSRYLTPDEIAALMKALDAKDQDQDISDVFRLLLYTGARRGEAQSATWAQFNLKEGVWTKPSSHTKQKKEHRVPLAAPAQDLLLKRRKAAEAELKAIAAQVKKSPPADRPALLERAKIIDAYVFPAKRSNSETPHVVAIKKAWATICKKAGLTANREVRSRKTGKVRTVEGHSARIHDLRHTAASVLASAGVSLPLIGQLLGHTQPATTARYAHLMDSAQRAAVGHLGAAITAGSKKPTTKAKTGRKA